MAHTDPQAVFVRPCKEAIQTALVAAGIDPMEISFNAVERNGRTGARITNSLQIPPVANVSEEVVNGGQRARWKGDNGETYVRSLRFTFILHFDVVMWAEELEKSTNFLFDFMRNLPRSITDEMPLTGVASPPSDEHGMPIKLTVLAPILPDDTTSTSKQYRTRCIVRAHGGIWEDKQVTVAVTPIISVSSTFAP